MAEPTTISLSTNDDKGHILARGESKKALKYISVVHDGDKFLMFSPDHPAPGTFCANERLYVSAFLSHYSSD